MKRSCKTCDTTFETTNSTKVYCNPACRQTRRSMVPDKPSSYARGYGPEHQRMRIQWKTKVDAGGVLCCLCSTEIQPDEPWHLDHTEDRTSYRGVAHRLCNLRDAQVRSALTVIARHYGVERSSLVAWLGGAGQISAA